MSIFDWMKPRKMATTGERTREEVIKDLPAGGQVSETPDDKMESALRSALTGANLEPAFFPFYILDVINTFVLTTPDMSQAVDNVVRLTNTGHRIDIFGGESQAQAMYDVLKDTAANVYEMGGGVDGLVNDLLGQVARTGALSVEWVVRNDLSGLDKVVLVPTKTIRFVYEGRWMPVQLREGMGALGANTQYIVLPESTYTYLAIERLDSSPYAIPPFLSALTSVKTQKDMMDNLRYVMRKLGLMGFLQVQVSPPEQNQGETKANYIARCKTYLKQVSENLKGSWRDGIVVGFKDLQELNHTPVTGDTRGVKDLWQLNEEQVSSGIKQDPAMLGRTYSTTETYAGVVLQKMISQGENYQRLIKRTIEKAYRLEAVLHGIPLEGLSMDFNESNLANRKERAEGEEIEIRNAFALRDGGIIDQTEAAQRLGYSEPALDGPANNFSEAEQEEQVQAWKKRHNRLAKPIPCMTLTTTKDGTYSILEKHRRVF